VSSEESKEADAITKKRRQNRNAFFEANDFLTREGFHCQMNPKEKLLQIMSNALMTEAKRVLIYERMAPFDLFVAGPHPPPPSQTFSFIWIFAWYTIRREIPTKHLPHS
jgi:hypothetical protein